MHQGRFAIRHDLIGQRLQLFHGFGHFVTRVFKVLRQIPDQRLHIDFVEKAVKLVVAVFVGIGPEVDPGLSGSVIVADPVSGAVLQRRKEDRARPYRRRDPAAGKTAMLGAEPASASTRICCSKLSEPT